MLLTENMRDDPFMHFFMRCAGALWRSQDKFLIDVSALAVPHKLLYETREKERIQVEEYMAALPNHVVPRTNSQGEKFREKQLMLQLPRQDLSVAYCRHLGSNVERKV